MTCVLRIKNDKGEWVNIPAITGESAYEIAVRGGFSGTEEEWLAYITPSVKAVSGGIWVTVGGETVFVANGTDGKDGEDGKTVTKMSELENDWGYLRKENEDIRLTAHQTYINGGSFVVGELSYGMSVSGNKIQDVGDPEAETDATNKAYVDNAVSKKQVPTKVSELKNDAQYISANTADEHKIFKFDDEAFAVYSKGVVLGGEEVYLQQGDSRIGLDEEGIHLVSEKGVKIYKVIDDENSAVNKGYVDGLVGSVESALDSILAMQNSLIGGDA